MWIYIFEDCDFCGGRGVCPGLVDGVMKVDAPCDLCEGLGRKPTNMSFKWPSPQILHAPPSEEYYP